MTLYAAAALLLLAGAGGQACEDGVLFVPHTNPHFTVPEIQAVLQTMLGNQGKTGRLLEGKGVAFNEYMAFDAWGDGAPNPTFSAYGGIKSNQNGNDCRQDTNAGLFYWPDGDLNTANPYYYNHDRTAMLAHTAAGEGGCKSQHLVLHPEFKPMHGKSLFDVPEYVREGIRVWANSVPTTTEVILVMPRAEDAAVVLSIAATFERSGTRNVTVLPVGFALAKLSGQTAANARPHFSSSLAIYQLLEAACMYSSITGKQYTAMQAGAAFGVQASDLTNVFAAAYAAVQEAKPYNHQGAGGGLGAAQWAIDTGVVSSAEELARISKGKSSWFVDVKHHTFRFESWGSSTEAGLTGAYNQVAQYAGMGSHSLGRTGKSSNIQSPAWRGTAANPTDVMLKRSMAFSPGPDNYFPTGDELLRYKTWMKFDYQYDKVVGSRDKGVWNTQCMDARYFGSTWSAVTKVLPMVENGQKANFFPMRWFIAEERTNAPGTVVMRDSQHLDNAYLQGVASGMLTLVTGGRSFVGDEPAGDTSTTGWQQWHARRTGYKMAWRLATMNDNPPWLEVKPKTKPSGREDSLRMLVHGASTVGDKVTVRFLEAPKATVVVTVAPAIAEHSTAVQVVPSSFTITPANFNVPVEVTVISTGAAEAGTDVSVVFSLASEDPAVDGVSDSWVWTTGPKGDTDGPVVDGVWSDFGQCSEVCGGGTQERTCTPPENGGGECQGSAAQACNQQTCPTVAPSTCPRPAGWCTHAGAVYVEQDCDGDGVKDPTCSDGDGQYGVRMSAAGCSDSWPTGECISNTCEKTLDLAKLELDAEQEQTAALQQELDALTNALTEAQSCKAYTSKSRPRMCRDVLVFRQTAGTYLSKDAWKSINSEDPNSDNYSILDQLEDFRDAAGKFEFMMTWPQNDKPTSNRWTQTSNPIDSEVAGYVAIDAPNTDKYWGGLEYNTKGSSLIDGSVGNGQWWFAIGTTQGYSGGIPGHSVAESRTELYVHTCSATSKGRRRM